MKTGNRIVNLLLLVLFASQLLSCKHDDSVPTELFVGVEQLEILGSGGEETIEIKCNKDWQVGSSIPFWLSIVAKSGDSFSISVSPNNGSEPREASLIITSEEVQKKVLITQAAKASISISSEKINASSLGGDLELLVTSNFQDWVISSDDKWIRAEKLSATQAKLAIAENTSEDTREGIVTLTADNQVRIIKVVQDFATLLALERTDVRFPWEGGEIKVGIQANKEVKAYYLEHKIKCEIRPDHLVLKIDPNLEAEEKELTIQLVSAEESIKIKVTIEASEYPRLQLEALRKLYESTDGDHWTRNDNWLSDKPIHEWYGITGASTNFTDKPGFKLVKVLSIKLDNNNLKGVIPEEIAELKELNHFNIANNNVRGQIPKSIVNLSKLTKLQLQNNQIEDIFPRFIFEKMSELRVIDLSNNNLYGEVDLSGIQPPENLKSVDLRYNKFNGNIPNDWVVQEINIFVSPQKEGYEVISE